MAHEKRIQDKHNIIESSGVNNIKESLFVSFILLSGKLFTRKESIFRRSSRCKGTIQTNVNVKYLHKHIMRKN